MWKSECRQGRSATVDQSKTKQPNHLNQLRKQRAFQQKESSSPIDQKLISLKSQGLSGRGEILIIRVHEYDEQKTKNPTAHTETNRNQNSEVGISLPHHQVALQLQRAKRDFKQFLFLRHRLAPRFSTTGAKSPFSYMENGIDLCKKPSQFNT